MCLVLLASALGCGGDDSGSGTVAGVPRNTALMDVSQSDVKALCKANESKLESLGSCIVQSIEKKSQTECETNMSACEKDPKTQMSSDIDCEGANTDGFKGCTVTVGEFSDCLDALEGYLTSLTCKDAGKTIMPPTCFQSISDKCPSLFDD